MVQIAMNSKVSDTIKISSYFVNFERKSNLFEQELDHVSIDLTLNRVKRFRHIKNNIQKMQFRFEKYVNEKRKKGPQLKEKDKVYLSIKNFTTKRLNKKLNRTKVRIIFYQSSKEISQL